MQQAPKIASSRCCSPTSWRCPPPQRQSTLQKLHFCSLALPQNTANHPPEAVLPLLGVAPPAQLLKAGGGHGLALMHHSLRAQQQLSIAARTDDGQRFRSVLWQGQQGHLGAHATSKPREPSTWY
eukprot:1158032-Pelagomonas_calceolata.AAC.6